MRRDRPEFWANPIPIDGSDWLVKRVPLLPPADSKPEFYEVELSDGYGDVYERVTLVGRWLGSWLVITGHSGASRCAGCSEPITPLEPIVLFLPAMEWKAGDFWIPAKPELWHDRCHLITFGPNRGAVSRQ